MNILRPVFALVLIAACAATPLAARQKAACTPQVQQGWIRILPGGMPMHGGFARIVNTCPQAVTITGARSTSYGSVELHETTMIDGVSRMRELKSLRIAPREAATLKPGGLHLMLMQPVPGIKAGSRIPVVFTLHDGREIVGEFTARAPD